MKRSLLLSFALLTTAACAASRAPPAAEPATPAAGYQQQSPQQGYPAQPSAPQGYPQAGQQPYPGLPATEATTPPAPSASGSPPNRNVSIAQSNAEIDIARRELDSAAGDCANACRALASMDRAAGRICLIAVTSDEGTQCTNAKTRLVSARDKVRSFCTSCPNASVEHDAPIPSAR